MFNLQQLSDIEEIHQLRARYQRYGDTKQWAEFAGLFTEDYEVDMKGIPRATPDGSDSVQMRGRDTIMNAWQSLMVGGIRGTHQSYLPEIRFTGPDTADGIWALHEVVRMPSCVFEGWGHYHESYVRVSGEWKISKTAVTRTLVEERWL